MDHSEWVSTLKPGDWTTGNRSPLKRFSHSARFKMAVRLVGPADGDRILDYGCSDGYFLELLKSAGSKPRVYGYDPLWSYYEVNKGFSDDSCGISFTDNVETFDDGMFDKITCLEVLEHLEERGTKKALMDIKRLLAKDGTVIVSVPIEVGFSSLLKNAVRIFSNQTHSGTNVITIAKSFFRMPIKRKGDGSYILSHIGFDYERLERTFTEMDFEVVDRVFSPFPLLGPYVNSQVFYVVRVLDRRTPVRRK